MQESEKLEAYWDKLAREATEFRGSLKELASLRGQPGPTDTVAADVLDLALKTGTTPERAAAAMAAYENIGPTVRAKGHYQPLKGTAAELESAVLADAIRTGKGMGVDEATSAEAIGVAGMSHTFRTREEAAQQFAGAAQGISEGKVPYTVGFRALNKAAAKLLDPADAAAEGARTGRIGRFDEAGIYLGALSLQTGTADQAQHRMVQNSRLLNPDAQNAKAVAALKTAGITDQMDDPGKLIQLSKFMTDQKIADPGAWLAENKLGTVATREGMVASLKIADVLEKRLELLRKGAKTNELGVKAIRENEKRILEDKAAGADQIAAATGVEEKATGLEMGELRKAKDAARLRYKLRDPAGFDSITRAVMNATIGNLAGYLGKGVGGEQLEYEQHAEYGALATLAKEGRKVGVDVYKQFPGLNLNALPGRAAAFEQAASAVRAAGGDPLGLKEITDLAGKRVGGVRSGMSAVEGPTAERVAKALELNNELMAAQNRLLAGEGTVPVAGPKPNKVPAPLPPRQAPMAGAARP
jgi:hypothetical protein